MEIEIGTRRIVFVFNSFVWKLAKIQKPHWRALYNIIFIKKAYQGFKDKGNKISHIFRPIYLGLSVNLQERRLYKMSRNKFLAPTYFSFLGICNIQKKRRVLAKDIPELLLVIDSYVYFLGNLAERAEFSHALLNKQNYGWDEDGHLQIIDYGDKAIRCFLLEQGDYLYSNFKENP